MENYKRYAVVATVLVAVLILTIAAGAVWSADVTLSFVDVGQGDSCLIQAGRGGNVLIDGGDTGSGETLTRYLGMVGVRELDAAVISHFHSDHCAGITELIRGGFPIRMLYLPRFETDTEEERELLQAAKDAKILMRRLRAGETFSAGKVKLHVLWPEEKGELFRLNNQSLILRMDYAETSVLFTGDSEAASQSELVPERAEELRADILKVPHHGGKGAVYRSFLYAVEPKVAVIEVGTDNYYGHPSEEMLTELSQMGTEVYRTDRDGVVQINLNKKGIKKIKTTDKWRKLQ